MTHYPSASRLRVSSSPALCALLCICALLPMFHPPSVVGQQQEKSPFQEFTPEEQIVSFPPSTLFEQALFILGQMATQFEGKVIIDLTGQKGAINVAVPPMHWRRALELVLTSRGLEFVERANYYEVRVAGAPAVMPPFGEPTMTLQTREVEISAVFFQGDRRSIAEAGIDWSELIKNDVELDVRAVGATGVTQEIFTVAADYVNPDETLSISAVLNAFEALNIGEIISRPTVTVLDGTQGRIQVGESFSIKQRDFAGNVTDAFFDVGTILTVTPKVIEDQEVEFIHLTIEADRSTAFPDPVSTRINRQNATTEVLLLDGEQTAIAGLFSEESALIRRGIPILKDLPWWFFGIRYLTSFSARDIIKKELVILIKAELVPTLEERLERRRLEVGEIIEEEREKFKRDVEQIPPT